MLKQNSAIKLVSQFVKSCNAINIYFEKVILFGSAANGKTHKWSDVDVALVSHKFTGNPFKDRHLLATVNIKFADIEPHPFSPDEFEEGDPFIDEIKKTGIAIKV